MTSAKGTPQRVVVDGSNLATEGRSLPSLAQLDEAVRAFREEHAEDDIIVVVDASFSYRIDESERQILDDAEEAGEIVSPPAGAIGRGDGFLLRIADRTGAVVLSNDSFQEFHGEYKWLFEEGRLIGGKPVPGVGWIFTPRTPVRGPKSRVAVRDAERAKRRTTKKVEEPVAEAIAEATAQAIAPDPPGRTKRGRSRGTSTPSPDAVNEPLPFITFIANHRLGSEVEGEVDSFTSHGAFVNADGARCYAPVVGLGDPPPRSAKEVLTRGEIRMFVVQALDPPRRGIELALPGLARPAGKPTEETVEAEIDEIEIAPPPPRTRRRTAAPPAHDGDATPVDVPVDVPVGGAVDVPVGGAEEAEGGAVSPAPRRRRRSAAPVASAAGAAAAPPATEEAPVPAKRSRRAAPKKAAAAGMIASAEPEAAGEPAAPPAAPPAAKAARKRTTRKATAVVADGQEVSDGAGTPGDPAVEAATDAPPAKVPAMRRSSTRAATKRATGAEGSEPPVVTPPAPKRTRKAASKVAPTGPEPAEATATSPASDPAPSPDPAPAVTRSGPRRSTIKRVTTATDAPGRSRPTADKAGAPAPPSTGRPRKAATKPPATPDDASEEQTPAKATGSKAAKAAKAAKGSKPTTASKATATATAKASKRKAGGDS